MSLKKILTNFRLGPFILLFYMIIQITKNSDVREEKKISASGPQNPLRGKLTFGLDRQKKIF